MKTLKILGVIFIALNIVNCAKSSKSSKSASTPRTSGYVTCPSNGYVMNNGASISCTPGSQVYTGGNNSTTGYTTCPQTGSYVSNGQTYSCTPGQQVYTGGNAGNPGGQQQGYCTMYTAQYGVPYVLVSYQGQYVCMRYDLAGGYQIIGY